MAVHVVVQKNILRQVARSVSLVQRRNERALAARIVSYARGYARVDTGYMRDHIVETPTGVESMAHYSAENEFGTRYMSAQPFMRPAAARAFAALPILYASYETQITGGGGVGDAGGLHVGRVRA